MLQNYTIHHFAIWNLDLERNGHDSTSFCARPTQNVISCGKYAKVLFISMNRSISPIVEPLYGSTPKWIWAIQKTTRSQIWNTCKKNYTTCNRIPWRFQLEEINNQKVSHLMSNPSLNLDTFQIIHIPTEFLNWILNSCYFSWKIVK